MPPSDRLRQITSLLFPAFVLLHSLIFLLFWLTNRLFYQDVNAFLADKVGSKLDYIALFMAFSSVVALTAAAWLGWRHSLLVALGWGIGLIYLIFFYGSFAMLFHESPIQVVRLRQMIGYFRLVPDAILLLGLAFLASQVLGALVYKYWLPGWAALAVIAVFIGLGWFLAWIYPPRNVYRSELPAKPLLIAHRGASMLAPENTLASAEVAAQLGVYGLETDVRISLDGTLFLMHDDTLQRTTDVASVFPGREKENAANFIFEQIRQLSAGKWFVEQDPSRTLASGLVKPGEIERYRSEPVPALAEELSVVRAYGLIFIFDLLAPPETHPHAADFFKISLDKVKSAGIDGQVWFLAGESEWQQVQALAPAMKLAAGISTENPLSAGDLVAKGYQIVNSEYSLNERDLRAYQKAGLWVNLWTVDESWQYSRLWLLGVPSVTSNNVQTFLKMGQPYLALPGWAYTLIWSGIGLLSMLVAWLGVKRF